MPSVREPVLKQSRPPLLALNGQNRIQSGVVKSPHKAKYVPIRYKRGMVKPFKSSLPKKLLGSVFYAGGDINEENVRLHSKDAERLPFTGLREKLLVDKNLQEIYVKTIQWEVEFHSMLV